MAAVTDAHATADQYMGFIGKTDGGDKAEIEDDLAAVSRYVESALVCNRFFTQDGAAVARVYVPSVYTDSIFVDDIASTSGLLIKVDTDRDGLFTDETAFAATDYQLWPLNADKGPEPSPWTRIAIPPWSSKGAFMPGYPVQVTAKFGWPAIPKAIVRATCELTAILRIESPRATARIPEGIDSVIQGSDKGRDIVSRLSAAYTRHGQGVFS